MITLNVRNPDDGTSTYNQIRIYRSTTQTGTFTLQSTVNIDLSGATEFSTGFTSYTDPTGDTTYWYEFSYYSSSTLSESTLSTAIQGGTAYLDSRIRLELSDSDSTAPNYPFWSNSEVAAARQDAVDALYPAYFKDWVDTSLTTVQGSWTYTLPPTLFNVSYIEVWDQTQSPYALITTIEDFDIVGGKIRLQNTSDVNLNSGYTMYIYCSKRITDSADVPSYMDDALIRKAISVLLRKLLWDRAKYQRYTTIIRPEGSNMPSIQSQIKDYEAFFANRLNQVKKGMPSRGMDLM